MAACLTNEMFILLQMMNNNSNLHLTQNKIKDQIKDPYGEV